MVNIEMESILVYFGITKITSLAVSFCTYIYRNTRFADK